MPQNYQVNPRRLEVGGHGLGRPPLGRTTQGGCGRPFPEAGAGNLLAGEAHPGAPLMGPSTQSCQDLHGLRTKTTWGSVPSRLGCVLHLLEEDSEFSVSPVKWSQQGGDELPTSVPAGDNRSTWEPVMIPGACTLRVSSEHHLAATTPRPIHPPAGPLWGGGHPISQPVTPLVLNTADLKCRWREGPGRGLGI